MAEVLDSRIETEEQLVQYIVAENPALRQLIKKRDVIGMALVLREWVSGLINLCSEDFVFYSEDILSAFNTLREKKKGVWCGGAAEFFTRILRLMGIRATTYIYVFRYGCPDAFGHATTLFCNAFEEGLPVYLVDAYLNCHYADSDSGDILSFDRLLKLISEKNYNKIRLVESPVRRSYLLPNEISFEDEGIRAEYYPDVKEIPEPIRRGDIWEHPSTRAIDYNLVVKGLRDRIDLYRGDRTVDEFMLDIMLYKSRINSILMEEVDERLEQLFESVRP